MGTHWFAATTIKPCTSSIGRGKKSGNIRSKAAPSAHAAVNCHAHEIAILVSVYTMYRWDASYAVAVQKAHPGRFGVVKPVNANDPKVEDTIAEWADMPGTVAIRIMMGPSV